MQKYAVVILLLLAMPVLAQSKSKKDIFGNNSLKSSNSNSFNSFGNTNSFSNKSTNPYMNNTPDRNYSNGGSYKIQNGYFKNDGSYVAPHLKTEPDNFKFNNKNYKIK